MNSVRINIVSTAHQLIEKINSERKQLYDLECLEIKNKKIKLKKPKFSTHHKNHQIKSWAIAPIETLVEKIVDCPHSTPKWTKSGIICLRTEQFKPFFRLEQEKKEDELCHL